MAPRVHVVPTARFGVCLPFAAWRLARPENVTFLRCREAQNLTRSHRRALLGTFLVESYVSEAVK